MLIENQAKALPTLTRITSPVRMADWGEVVQGPLSAKALSVIEEFLGVKPKVTSHVVIDKIQIPNVYSFLVPGMSNQVKFQLRIWQYGTGSYADYANIDIGVYGGDYPASGLKCGLQEIGWIGIGHSQLLIATRQHTFYRVTSQYRREKVAGFWVEMSPLEDTRQTGFNKYVPDFLF